MSHETDNRQYEQRRVEMVIEEIDHKEEKLYVQSAGLKQDVVELRQTFWDDVTVNLEELDDVIETQESIKQQAALLSQKERFHGKINEEIKTLQRLRNAPYFGRIDFIEEPGIEKESLYIGIASLMDRGDEDFLIYDWRAPISSLYYDFSPGPAYYQTLDSTIHGEMTLKRQFIMKQGTIEGMFDTGVTIGDELLQKALGNNASTTMKNIVATIQKEQNKIIRNERSKLLIVQGVAGSGKTSAALQRIAYLMYRYREELHADNIVLFSPNPLFSSYISNVLPELGETNVRQMTFLDYLRKGINESIAIESPFEQMEYVLTQMDSEGYSIRMKSMEYLSTIDFMQLIDAFTTELQQGGMEFKPIKFRGDTLITKEELEEYFYSLDKQVTIPNKMEMVAKWLHQELLKRERKEMQADWVMEQIELLDKEDYMRAYHQAEEKFQSSTVQDEERLLRKYMVKRFFRPLKKRIKQLEFVNILATYSRMFTEWEPKAYIVGWKEIRSQISADLAQRFLTWENATPYLYFKGRLLGASEDRSVRQLIIDEAQDYSSFQFAYIKHLFPYTRMTLLGDINQAIYTHVTKDNPLIPAEHTESHERITLTKSYRSTKQIVDFTTYFAPGDEQIEPFNREGGKPELIKVQVDKDWVTSLLMSVEEQLENGHETVALICKTLEESKRIYQLLQDKLSVHLVNEETYSFEKGVLVLPVYLAKGIEFDAVIIPDASADKYPSESEKSLFYTACTRAMHALTMISIQEPNVFIKGTPEELYNVKS
ncbi:RNA polymerase recycling motor HelD [Oceanobacillus sp. FSL K6-2867]|uniref:RNA polymerase recycling motor HelD n=1 Tax=Oceanobacillus sp. FSL K6-2867 TaxID=2954748 RepID=UPI0030D89537